jgi:integrase
VKHAYRILHTALECAVSWKLIPSNPAERVKAPKVESTQRPTFSVDQAKALLSAAAASGTKWHAVFHLAITTGLRPGEMMGLRWADVDLAAGILRVQQASQRVRRVGRITKAPKSATGRRTVDLGSDVIALLYRHRVEQNTTRLQMGPLWKDSDLVFPSEVGTPLEPTRVHKVFTKLCSEAHVPRIRPYDLRHTSASLALADGHSLKVVQERLGHTSASLTLATYAHVLPTTHGAVAEGVDTMLRAQ